MIQTVSECASTNSAISPEAPHGYALRAVTQTAGRGQRGNSWEAEPGMNVTLSLMLRPANVRAADQFAISEAVALGVADLLDGLGVDGVAVKWPNDVYVGNGKIAGVLIENSLTPAGMLVRSIAGIGLNVNQTVFVSPAPNPVSLKQITGQTYDVGHVAERMVGCILRRLERGGNHDDYRARLWRGKGVWPWTGADGSRFSAAINDVLPSGHLVLNGKAYAFKEVRPDGFAN